jgi:hypothetical protein
MERRIFEIEMTCPHCGMSANRAREAEPGEGDPTAREPGKLGLGLCFECGEWIINDDEGWRKPTDDEHARIAFDEGAADMRLNWSAFQIRMAEKALVELDGAFADYLKQECDYFSPVLIPGGRYAAVNKQVFNMVILIGKVGDRSGWEEEFSYRGTAEVAMAMAAWAGQKFKGAPRGWIRHVGAGGLEERS